MLVDMDYFFAQCEETRNPSLKDKPLVICVYSGRSEESGVVSTANYIARKYGVRSGIPISIAKKKLSDKSAVFLPTDHVFYGQVSSRIMEILLSFADRFEKMGIDEAYLDVTQKVTGDFGKAEELAREIKENINVKEEMTCSIGVGPNKIVAKIAADFKKPDGLTIVKPEGVKPFLFPLSVDKLIGVGKKTYGRMQELGIETIGELAEYDPQKLIESFGTKTGTYFHSAANGIDREEVQERGEAESIGRISTLKEDTRDLNSIMEKTDMLCEEVYMGVTQRGLSFKTIGIVAIMEDLSTKNRAKSFLTPTNELGILKQTTHDLLRKLLEETELKIRRTGVHVSNLSKDQSLQKHLTDYLDNLK
jgi:DNA polymerase IV (DinB-like DNA polymerase)